MATQMMMTTNQTVAAIPALVLGLVPAPELVRVHNSSSGCRWCCVQAHIVSCMLCSSWQTAGTQGALLPTVHVSFHLRQYHVEHGQALQTPRRL